jgi:hypothetical protein
LRSQRLNGQAVDGQQRRVARQRHGVFDPFQASVMSSSERLLWP